MDMEESPSPHRKPIVRTRVVLAALVVAWLIFATFPRPTRLDRPLLSPPSPAARADYRWSLRDLDGKAIDFGDYKGRAVFLNIWATWCPPCRAELPAIASLAANPRLKGVAFLCASTDEDLETLRAFVKGRNLSLPIARADSLPDVFQTEGIPATFVIAPDGAIVVAEVGGARWDDPAVVDFLETLAKRSP